VFQGAIGRSASELAVGNDPLSVDADDAPEPLAGRAGAERRVEREERRGRRRTEGAADRAGELGRVVRTALRRAPRPRARRAASRPRRRRQRARASGSAGNARGRAAADRARRPGLARADPHDSLPSQAARETLPHELGSFGVAPRAARQPRHEQEALPAAPPASVGGRLRRRSSAAPDRPSTGDLAQVGEEEAQTSWTSVIVPTVERG
jgi:hypothetical protein